jgi:4a-hydroxytetrahydrobiopterin dehydratase
MSELALRTCVPCRGGVPPLDREQCAVLLAQLEPAWHIAELSSPKFASVDALQREYSFADFALALEAANRVGALAEEQQHHPDLHVSWGRLGVTIWTHKIGGLTESDFIFAAKCDVALAAAGRSEP